MRKKQNTKQIFGTIREIENWVVEVYVRNAID